jgi:hypothetical protein
MKRLLILLLALTTSGCVLDGNRQEDLRFPATLTVHNRTGHDLQVSAIYSHPEYGDAFILNGFFLQEGKYHDISISESTYEGLTKGYGVMDLQCAQQRERTQRSGDFTLVPNSTWPKVAVEVVSCTKGQEKR